LRDSDAKALFTQRNLLGNEVKAAKETGIRKEKIVLIGEEREQLLAFTRLAGGC